MKLIEFKVKNDKRTFGVQVPRTWDSWEVVDMIKAAITLSGSSPDIQVLNVDSDARPVQGMGMLELMIWDNDSWWPFTPNENER